VVNFGFCKLLLNILVAQDHKKNWNFNFFVCWLLSEVVFTFVLIRFDTYNFILFPLTHVHFLTLFYFFDGLIMSKM